MSLVSSGSDCRIISGYDVIPESANAIQDAIYDYPLGLQDYSLTCANNGEIATVVFYFDQEYDTSSWVWRKFDRSGQVYATMQDQVAYGTSVVGSSSVTTATYTVTDGGPLDEDGVVNGIIIDPSGPAVLAQGNLAETGVEVYTSFIAGGLILTLSLGLLIIPKYKEEEVVITRITVQFL